MLAVTSYPEVYTQLAAARIQQQLTAFAALSQAVKGHPEAEAALEAFVPGYCDALLLALDHHFMHRMRGAEGKDGNPLNEARMLVESIMENEGVFKVASSIKYKPEDSVTGHRAGDTVKLDPASVQRLADAYIAEIGKRYG